MKAEDIVSLARTRLKDTANPPLWTDDELLEFVNDAQIEACRRARLIVDSTTEEVCRIDLEAGVDLYDLDPRVLFIRRAKLATRSVPLCKIRTRDLDVQNPGWESAAGTVDHYVSDYQTGSFRPYRIPTAADYAMLTVVRLPLRTLTMESLLEIKDAHQRSLVYWVCYRAYEKQDADTEDAKRAANNLALFEQEYGKKSTAIDERWIEDNHGYDGEEGLY